MPQEGALLENGDCCLQNAPNESSKVILTGVRANEDVKIGAAVGLSATNKYDDVMAIQYALDKVPPLDGGPNPQIKIDGNCGQETIRTIQNFQLKQFGWPGMDGKVEPERQTHLKLRELSKKYQVFPYLPLDLTADAWFLAAWMSNLEYAKVCVHAAMTNLLGAIPLADSKSNEGGGGLSVFSREERLKLANRHFEVDKFPAARPVLTKLYGIYGNMLAVLSRPEFYFTLDTDDSGEKISPIAFARIGGFFGKDLNGKIRFRRGSFKASLIPQFAVHVIVHELTHFTERENENGHFAKGWVEDPKMQKLLPSQKIHNADTFANFALEARYGTMNRPDWMRKAS
jgi:hypothetical protein